MATETETLALKFASIYALRNLQLITLFIFYASQFIKCFSQGGSLLSLLP